ncbi:MAG: gamma-glutamyltransferase family protein [Chitinophagaceae bacterium]|nr:gamma-glutamyltransferase family protein [Chitinophagaceae bacterium]
MNTLLNYKKTPLVTWLWPVLFFLLLNGCASRLVPLETLPPDLGQRMEASHAMVSTAHPIASRIGVEIMKKGGNVIDAAVASSLAVGVLEPEMSGIGGGGSMVIWLQKERKAVMLDFYPSKRTRTYLNVSAKQGPDNLLVVGVPGMVAGLLYAHEKYGRLSRQEVMQPAIELATEGFPMYLTLHDMIESSKDKIKKYKGASLFLPDDKPFPVGKTFRQPDLARTLQKISDEGVGAFYEGEVAKNIISVLNAGQNPVTPEDFRGYKVLTDKNPLSGSYKGSILLTAAPPQSGMEILEGLNLVEPFDLKKIGLPTQSDSAFNILASAMRVHNADNRFINDPRWVEVPVSALTSKEYAGRRSKVFFDFPVPEKVSPAKINKSVAVGEPEAAQQHTTSLSLVDEDGNAVALTQTNSSMFGSGAWVDGFFLNDSGFDFSRLDHKSENSPEYRTRKSTIAPTIILDADSTVRMIIGSPGGNYIPAALVQSIIYMLEYGMDPMAALRMPRIYAFASSPRVQIEKHIDGDVLQKADRMGYEFVMAKEGARIYVIKKVNGKWVGAADPRHEGGVAGY